MTSPPRLPSFSSFVSGERSSGNLQTENRENVQGVRASFAQESPSRSSLPPLAQILPHSTSPYPSAISIFPAPSVYRRHPEAPRLLSSSAGITTPPLDNSSRVPATHEFSPAGNTSSPYSLPYHPARAIPIPESSSPGSTFSNNSSRVPSTHESISPGLLPSFASHERTDTSIANTSSQASPSPTFSASGLNYIHHPAVLRHRQPHPSPLSSYPASDSLPSSSREPSPSPRLSDYPYASLGGPISSPPYQTLPAPDFSASRLNPNRLAVDVNGCLYIRNAISHALVRDVVAAIDCGLPVVTKLKTLQTYATSIQADKVRDEFILVYSPILLLSQGLIGFSITEISRRRPNFLRGNWPNRSRDASSKFRRVFHGK